MKQDQLTDASETPIGESAFDRARAKVGKLVKLILVADRRPAQEHTRHHAMLAVDHGSAWGDLLPDEQMVRVLTREQHEAEREHELAIFAHWLKYDDPAIGRRRR